MKRGIQLALCAILTSGALLFGRSKPRPPMIMLSWTSAQTGMVFNVRSIHTSQVAVPSLSWPIVATTTDHSVTLPIDQTAGSVWFTVTASNALGESPFATP